MTADDLPAAHSMDTEWFAVDADGHVACFDTGEDGAFPDDGWPAATSDEKTSELATSIDVVRHAFTRGWLEPDPELLRRIRDPDADEATRHAFFVDARARLEGPLAAHRAELARRQALPWWRRLFLRTAAPKSPYDRVRGGLIALAAGTTGPSAFVQPHGDVDLSWIDSIAFDVLAELHRDGRCRGCGDLDDFDDLDALLARAGIFHYKPALGYSSPLVSPYRRDDDPPVHPRRLDEFDPAFVRRLGLYPFPDVRFTADLRVQPARTAVCTTYVDPSPAYLDTDLRTIRPQRGMESLYLEMRVTLERVAAEHDLDPIFTDP